MSFLLCKAFVGLPHREPEWFLGQHIIRYLFNDGCNNGENSFIIKP